MTPMRHRINAALAPLATAWVSVARGQRDYLTGTKRIPPARLHVIPNGIDLVRRGGGDANFLRARRTSGYAVHRDVDGKAARQADQGQHSDQDQNRYCPMKFHLLGICLEILFLFRRNALASELESPGGTAPGIADRSPKATLRRKSVSNSFRIVVTWIVEYGMR